MTASADLLNAASPVQRWIVRNGLPDVHPPGDVSLDELGPSAGWAAEHRLTGLRFKAAGRLNGDVPAEVADAHLAALRQGLAVEVEACRAVTVLRQVGIEPIVFKGVASAHLDHSDPGDRTFYDVDLLVARASFTDAASQLDRAGWKRLPSALGPNWESRYARAAQFVAPSGAEVDLHASIAAGYFGVRLDHEALRRSTESFALGGVDITCFDADARLLTSCYALVLSRGGSIRLVRDVAQQILQSDASWERAGRLAGDGDVVIAAGLEIANEWIELPPGAMQWSQNRTNSVRQRLGLRLAASAEQRGWRSDATGEMLGLGMLDRLRYSSAVIVRRARQMVKAG